MSLLGRANGRIDTYAHAECTAKVVQDDPRTGIPCVIHLQEQLRTSRLQSRAFDLGRFPQEESTALSSQVRVRILQKDAGRTVLATKKHQPSYLGRNLESRVLSPHRKVSPGAGLIGDSVPAEYLPSGYQCNRQGGIGQLLPAAAINEVLQELRQ